MDVRFPQHHPPACLYLITERKQRNACQYLISIIYTKQHASLHIKKKQAAILHGNTNFNYGRFYNYNACGEHHISKIILFHRADGFVFV
jgi:hypothetical protein